MAYLVVKLHSKEVQRLELREGQDYVVGRSEECDITLESAKGISRQHLKIYFDEGVWVCELTSRYGSMIHEGEDIEALELQDNTLFSIPPYDFEFTQPANALVQASSPKDLESLTPPPEPEEDSQESAEELSHLPVTRSSSLSSQNEEPQGNLDATAIGSVSLTSYLKIQSHEGDIAEVLKLEGNLWVAGRDENCEIVLRDTHVSRKHFEITQINGVFYITDLGSANGTRLNETPLPAKEATEISSGDVISIKKLRMRFEVYDGRFDKQLATIDAQVPMASGGPNFPSPFVEGPAVMKVEPPSGVEAKLQAAKKLWDNKRTRAMMIVIAVIALALVFSGDPDSQKGNTGKKDLAGKSKLASFDKLTPEQKAVVKDTFEVARHQFTQGKFELCSSEIAKLHDIVPFYENSKELETFCKQAKELEDIERDKQRKTRAQKEIEQKIAAIVTSCQEKIEDIKTEEELNQCLADAIELNPAHPSVEDLRGILRLREDEAKAKQEAKAKYQRRLRMGEKLFKEASAHFEKEEFLKAKKAYEKLIQSKPPDPKGHLPKAKENLAIVKEKLKEKVGVQLSACKKLLNDAKYKEAIVACDQARSEDPTNREVASVRTQARSELRREMKSLYEDAILEESLGNVDAAKEKWKQILDQDLGDGEYRRKARIKLKKYGIGP